METGCGSSGTQGMWPSFIYSPCSFWACRCHQLNLYSYLIMPIDWGGNKTNSISSLSNLSSYWFDSMGVAGAELKVCGHHLYTHLAHFGHAVTTNSTSALISSFYCLLLWFHGCGRSGTQGMWPSFIYSPCAFWILYHHRQSQLNLYSYLIMPKAWVEINLIASADKSP